MKLKLVFFVLDSSSSKKEEIADLNEQINLKFLSVNAFELRKMKTSLLQNVITLTTQ